MNQRISVPGVVYLEFSEVVCCEISLSGRRYEILSRYGVFKNAKSDAVYKDLWDAFHYRTFL